MDRSRGRAARSNRKRAVPVRDRLPELRRVPSRAAEVCARAIRRGAAALALAGIATGVGGAGYAGYRFLTTSPRFAIERIAVTGAATLTPDQVRARIPVGVGDNVFLASPSTIEAALEREPWIADATARRRLPRTIEIEIVERRAAALVELGGLYLADDDGQVFKRAALDGGEGSGLPVVTGINRDDLARDPAGTAERIRRALATLAAWREDGGRPGVGEIRVDVRHGVTLYTFDDAVAVRLGEADGDLLTARLARFDAAWAALSPDERRRARAIHLDHDVRPDHVTVALR